MKIALTLVLKYGLLIIYEFWDSKMKKIKMKSSNDRSFMEKAIKEIKWIWRRNVTLTTANIISEKRMPGFVKWKT